MAIGGYTELEAVNQMLASVGIRQVASVSSETGSDDASDALRVLNRTSTSVQARGWPSNTDVAKSFTAADIGGGVYQIDLSASNTVAVLRTECLGPGRYRGNIEVRNDRGAGSPKTWAYITTEGTKDFGSAAVIMCDVVYELDFNDECPADLQEVIVSEAISNFKAEREGQAMFAQSIANRNAKAEVTANRGVDRPNFVHTNSNPLIPGGGGSQ